MKSVCRAGPANPSQSLVKPYVILSLLVQGTDWGCKHEQTARDSYFKAIRKSHDGFQESESGLVLNLQWPYLGALPDRIVCCDYVVQGYLRSSAHIVPVQTPLWMPPVKTRSFA